MTVRELAGIVVFLWVAVLAGACTQEASVTPTDTKLESETVETYPIRGIIRDRNLDTNSILIEHEEIPGFMRGMTMSFRVDGTDVSTLPPEGSTVEGRLNVAGVDYWLTELRQVEAAPAAPSPTEADSTGDSGPAGD